MYEFVTVAVEAIGSLADSAMNFLRDLSRRIASFIAESNPFNFLVQRLSVAMQRGNAACVSKTIIDNGVLRHDLTFKWCFVFVVYILT